MKNEHQNLDELENFKNRIIVLLAYKFVENYNFTRNKFEDIMAQILISTTIEELKNIKF